MNTFTKTITKLTAVAALALSSTVASADTALELGLITPIQITDDITSVRGLRIGIIYTENADVTGLDINVIAGRVRGDFTGLQLSLINIIDGNMTGVQFGGVNIVQGEATGAQFGFVNYDNMGNGAAFGVVNYATSYHGLQFGFVNYARELEGLQIGLINIAKNSELYQVLPILNFNFKF